MKTAKALLEGLDFLFGFVANWAATGKEHHCFQLMSATKLFGVEWLSPGSGAATQPHSCAENTQM